MTDRELLEMAAKAAGLEYIKPTEGYDGSYGLAVGSNPMRTSTWSPFRNDGDALRLAVKLGLLFKPEFAHFLGLERFAGQDRDDYSAHRRAIVRAAAEIGKAMP